MLGKSRMWMSDFYVIRHGEWVCVEVVERRDEETKKR